MSRLYENVKKNVIMLLRDVETPTAEQIKQYIGAVLQMQRQLGRTEDVDEATLFRDISSLINTWQADSSALRDGKHKNWLPDRKTEIEWSFWKRYRQYLEDEKNWSTSITTRLDRITDSILGDVGNPAQRGRWDRRGMVVGEVQSGKTANYTGLICKSVDAGYKLIIVLAGMTNDLRSQTQSRLDAEFLGFKSEVGELHSSGSHIGVGKIEVAGQLIAYPLTYSSKNGDFRANKSVNLQLGGTPLLLVVKKNTSVLKRILAWVQNQGKLHQESGKKVVDDIPLLLLDDEADNASVNTKSEDEDPTAINRTIRQILNSFQQSSYVGYTATPFANIFILPDEDRNLEYGDDLFPKGFIYHISPPSNYIGPARLFGLIEDFDDGQDTANGLPLIRQVDDAGEVFPPSHKKELVVNVLPNSLIKALQSFIINCAARRVRSQKEVHNSMLIHVTRFNLVQGQVLELIKEELTNIHRMIEYNTGPQAAHLFQQMEKIWEEDYVPTYQNVCRIYDDPQLTFLTWKEVCAQLLPAITKILVRGVNGDIGNSLDYDQYPNGLNVIAVGGDKLSRGLTLEGLSVSYYVRPAKNYDTLLQMGRWFGYRPGYVDLCRLYTTEDLIGWYEHIAVANEELRREFVYMEHCRLTPDEYGLKVRTHPGGLSITAANKIRHGKKMQVSFSGHLVQTTIFHKNTKVQEENFKSTERWLQSLSRPVIEKHRPIWHDISPTHIIDFLENYTSHPLCRQAESDLLIQYVQKMLALGELKKWTVALISSSASNAAPFTIAGSKIGLIQRTDKTPDDKTCYMLQKSNILSPEDEHIDISEEQKAKALTENIAAWQAGETRSRKEPKKPSGPFIRKVRSPQNGLLLLYPLDYTQFEKPFTSNPIIGFAISFPESDQGHAGAIEYQVNTKYWLERYGEEDDDS
jgi:hypothetical protein